MGRWEESRNCRRSTRSGAGPEAQLATLIDSGRLEGSKVALSATPTTIELAETMSQILSDADIEVVSVTNFQSPSSDQFAIDNEMDVNFERWRSDGADAVVAVPGASVPTTGVLSRNGWDGAYVITDAPGTDLGLLEGFSYGTEALVGSIAIVPADEADLYEAGQAGVRECIDTFDNAFDDDPPVELRPEDLRTSVVGLIVRSCQALELFKAIAELAGPDLTNESFDAAADEIGAFTVTGVLGGSLGPGKRDYIDAGTALFVFDEDLSVSYWGKSGQSRRRHRERLGRRSPRRLERQPGAVRSRRGTTRPGGPDPVLATRNPIRAPPFPSRGREPFGTT